MAEKRIIADLAHVKQLIVDGDIQLREGGRIVSSGDGDISFRPDGTGGVDLGLEIEGLLAEAGNTNTIYVDSSRTDDYTETGSRLYPYKNVQAALNANTAGGEVFHLAPGTYGAASFTANNQTIIGSGSPENTAIYQADTDIVDGGAFTGLWIHNVTISMDAPTAQRDMIKNSAGGYLTVYGCILSFDGNAATITGEQPCITAAAGTIIVDHCSVTYTNDITAGVGAAAIKKPFCVGDGGLTKVVRSDITLVTSNSAFATSMCINEGTGAVIIMSCYLDVTDTGATFCVGLAYLLSATNHEFAGNRVHVNGTGDCYGIYLGGPSITHSFSNHIHVESSGGNANSFFGGGAGYVSSHNDDLVAADGISGNVFIASSELDGEFTASLGNRLNDSPVDNRTGNGLFVRATVGENVARGDILYLKNDGKYWRAQADAAGTMPGVVMAMEVITADTVGKLLLQGYYRDDDWAWAVGGRLFVHTTAGDPTQTAPVGVGQFVQAIGYAVSADVIYLSPDMAMVAL